MRIFKEIRPLREYSEQARRQGLRLGLVPTMGALHEGHLSLIKASRAENDVTICSIFVNPIQFNNPSDLEKYPTSAEEDLRLLKDAGCDAVFTPSASDMYPGKPQLTFDFGPLDKILEGQFRPGHFSGVALVVSKLFHIADPQTAYFGQKDYQQFCIIRELVQEANFPVELRCMPIVREADGLAMSSRNRLLAPEERQRATVFINLLREARTRLAEGETWSSIQSEVMSRFHGSNGVRIEYFEAADAKTLRILRTIDDTDHSVLLIAGYIGEIRLIDNLLLNDPH